MYKVLFLNHFLKIWIRTITLHVTDKETESQSGPRSQLVGLGVASFTQLFLDMNLPSQEAFMEPCRLCRVYKCNSPFSLSQEAWEELCLVQNKLQKQFLTHIKLDLPLELFILSFPHSPTGLLAWQKHPVEWIYTHFREIKSFTSYLDLIALIIINKKKD